MRVMCLHVYVRVQIVCLYCEHVCYVVGCSVPDGVCTGCEFCSGV